MSAETCTSCQPRHPSWRWARALLLVALVAAGCFLAVRTLAPKLRDPGPAEIKAALADGLIVLEQAIRQVNKLSAEARREVMRSPQAQSYFQRLGPGQRLEFVRRTLDRGIQLQIERYEGLSKEERRAFVAELQRRQRGARDELGAATPGQTAQAREVLDAAGFAAVMERAAEALQELSSSDEGAELAPLFEGVLQQLNNMKDSGR